MMFGRGPYIKEIIDDGGHTLVISQPIGMEIQAWGTMEDQDEVLLHCGHS